MLIMNSTCKDKCIEIVKPHQYKLYHNSWAKEACSIFFLKEKLKRKSVCVCRIAVVRWRICV
jgi:hypothetical protein